MSASRNGQKSGLTPQNFDTTSLRVRLPEWAIWAGFPSPGPDEPLPNYVERLGLDPAPLLEDLNERTACIANMRLATLLMREAPDSFDAYMDERRKARTW